MKLLQIKGKRALTATSSLLRPLNNLVKDERIQNLLFSLTNNKSQDEEEAKTFGLRFIMSFLDVLPDLLDTHQDDIIQMFAIIQDVTVEEYEENITVSKLLSDINEIRQDEDLLSLFFSANRRKQSN